VDLEKSAQVQISLYAITGEVVYQTALEGNPGLNPILWRLANQGGQAVASGLYVYVIRVNDGVASLFYRGRVVVIH
jgi:hypothetical protein